MFFSGFYFIFDLERNKIPPNFIYLKHFLSTFLQYIIIILGTSEVPGVHKLLYRYGLKVLWARQQKQSIA